MNPTNAIIKEIQAAVARELAAQSEVPKTVPQRIADLLRELHRRLRNPSHEAAPRFGVTERTSREEAVPSFGHKPLATRATLRPQIRLPGPRLL